jgi:hypothetical protein
MTCRAVASKIYVSTIDSCGEYFEDFGGTLSEEFSDCGACVAEMTVIDFETFKITFSEVIDSSTVDGLADFVGIFKEKSAEFTGNCTTDGRL